MIPVPLSCAKGCRAIVKFDFQERPDVFHFLKCVFAGNYVLNYLATQPKLPNFVIQALVTLFARISKLGWFDSDKEEFVFRNVVSDVAKFLQVWYPCSFPAACTYAISSYQ